MEARHRNITSVGRAIAVLLLTTPAPCGQGPVDPSKLTFRTESRLVQVSVIAQNAKGNPITDLRREDFQLLDNGVPQPIRLFLAGHDTPTPPADAPRLPNTFTNRIDAGTRGGYSVLLLDTLNTNFGDPLLSEAGIGAAAQDALRVLRTIPPGDGIAIYSLQRARLRIVQEFTVDRDLLERRLRAWKASADTPGLFDQTIRELVDPPNGVRQEFGRIDGLTRDAASQAQMEQLADHLAGVPGRKNLVWLASRFAIGPAALRKLSNAGVAVYPVDVMGSCNGCLERPKGPMQAIAAATGGVSYSYRNDLDSAIRQALDDGRVSYTLGFYRPGTDTAPHKLEVRVSRPGVDLRYRGSYATDTPPHAGNADAEMAQALRRPIDATQLPVTVTVTRKGDRLDLLAALNVDSLELAPDMGRWRGKVDFAARFTAADESVLGTVFHQTLTLDFRQDTYDKARSGDGVAYHNSLKIPEKATEVKLLFANLAAGKTGTLTIHLADVQPGAAGK